MLRCAVDIPASCGKPFCRPLLSSVPSLSLFMEPDVFVSGSCVLCHRCEQFLFGKWLCQVEVRANDAPSRLVEQAIFAGQHDDWRGPVLCIVLDNGAGLVPIK